MANDENTNSSCKIKRGNLQKSVYLPKTKGEYKYLNNYVQVQRKNKGNSNVELQETSKNIYYISHITLNLILFCENISKNIVYITARVLLLHNYIKLGLS